MQESTISQEGVWLVVLVASCLTLTLSLIVCVWFKAKLIFCLSCCDSTAASPGVDPRHPAFAPRTENVVFEPLPGNLSSPSVTAGCAPEEGGLQTISAQLNDRGVLRFTDTLGYSWFGWVVQGVTQGGKKVIVKILRDEATPEEVDRFRREHDVLAMVRHENIVEVVMGCFTSFPLLSVLHSSEYVSVKQFLRERRNAKDISLMIQLCMDSCAGLAALHAQGLAHPDLAARTCVLNRFLTLQLCDYGLGRALSPHDYWPILTDSIPLRWTAPAQVTNPHNRTIPTYTRPKIQDNQWTLGILLWEIATWGQQPYGNTPDREVLALLEKDGDVRNFFKLESGRCLRSRCLLSLVLQCLNLSPTRRPRVERLEASLQDIAKAGDLHLIQLYRELTIEDNYTEVNLDDYEEEFNLNNQALVMDIWQPTAHPPTLVMDN